MDYAKVQTLADRASILGKAYLIQKLEREIKETDRLLDKYVARYNDDIRHEWDCFIEEDKRKMEYCAEHKRFLEAVKVELERR